MKVVQFLVSTAWGGLESVFVDLSNALSKIVNVEVIVFQKSAVIEKFDKSVDIHLLYSNPSRYNPLLYIELYILLQKLQPDIVHTHSAKATQIFYMVNKLLDIRHVATKHNARKGKIFNKLKNVVAVSKEVKKSIMVDNVKIIYNGIKPVEVLRQNKDEVFSILAVGRLDKIKGFDILIKECAKLNFPFRLHIVGEGSEKETLEALIEKLQLKDKVNLIGFKKDIPQRMKNADIVVMSSHSEGFSLVLVEALFYANLFVSTKVSGAAEILDEMFLFDGFNIAAKINDIYQHYQVYQKAFEILGQKSKNLFLLDRVVQEHLEYYQEILEKS